jgi:hypothetical protein
MRADAIAAMATPRIVAILKTSAAAVGRLALKPLGSIEIPPTVSATRLTRADPSPVALRPQVTLGLPLSTGEPVRGKCRTSNATAVPAKL